MELQLRALLYNLRSAYNVGSILRTASSLNFEKIYFFGITPTPSNRKVKKTALGAEEYVSWEQIKNFKKTILELKKEKFQIVALEQSPRSIILQNFKPSSSKIVLIVGNEVKGLNQRVLNLADSIVEIPIFGQKESLNVTIAFAVAAYFLVLSQKFKKIKL